MLPNIYVLETEVAHRQRDLDRVLEAERRIALAQGDRQRGVWPRLERNAFVILMNVKEVRMKRGVFTAVTRRVSLLTLGTIGLAALMPFTTTDARKNEKSRKKSDDKKARKR